MAGDISGSSLGLGQGLNPTLVPLHRLAKTRQYVLVLPNAALLAWAMAQEGPAEVAARDKGKSRPETPWSLHSM